MVHLEVEHKSKHYARLSLNIICLCSLLTQLNIYAKFTSQNNVERSNTFARAVCAGELYDIYYNGQATNFSYIIIAAAIAGPLSLVLINFS